MTVQTNNAQTTPAPLPGRKPVICSVCKAVYLPDGEGRRSHHVVFGHRPDELIDIDPGDIFEAELVEERVND